MMILTIEIEIVTKKKITIKDIARECGVGLGTASRAINGKPGVKEDIRRKVLQYVEDIGWRSNNIYTRLKTSDEGQMVVFIASTSTFEKRFDNDLLRRLMEELPNHGFTPVVYYGRCRENLERCVVMKPHTVVILGINDHQKALVEQLQENGTRVFGLGQCDDYVCPLVYSDPCSGAQKAYKLLKKAGHQKIGFFGGMGVLKKLECLNDVNMYHVKEMLTGICELEPGFSLENSAISDSFSDLEILKKHLQNRTHTAWICSDEKMVRQFLHCATELTISIPEDVSLISFTPDLPFYSFTLDLARFYSDNAAQAKKMIQLITADKAIAAQLIPYNYKLHKGRTVIAL